MSVVIIVRGVVSGTVENGAEARSGGGKGDERAVQRG
jgi:hypothetical protein